MNNPVQDAGQFPMLSSPVTIGPLELRNRVILLPHGTCYAVQHLPSQQHFDYYRARARGGAAMICVESAVVSGDGDTTGPLVRVSDPRSVEGFSRIADGVHSEGALIQGQLAHFGNQSDVYATRAPMLAPSHVPDAGVRQVAKPMTRADMERVRDDFVTGARHFKAAGFDSIDLKVGHDGLLRQFLSPLTNVRDDEYGGSRENRLRYVLEVAAAIRAEIGPELGFSVRLCLDECFAGGFDLQEGLEFAKAFAESGLFSHITPTLGVYGSAERIIAPMPYPEGYAEYAFGAASKVSVLPVVAVGLLHSPEYAERLLVDPGVAAIGMARELIAEPEWANKVLSGRANQVRPCTACNDLCYGNTRRRLPVSCTVNPQAGYGDSRPAVASRPGQLVVVGGGPAGMEAARTAAEDGFSVVLFERGVRLGGMLALAGDTGGRTGWVRYLQWLEQELVRLGVELRVGREATPDVLRALQPIGVVIACGSRARPSSIEGVLTIEDFLTEPRLPGHVVLADMGLSGIALWSTALEAATGGAERVTLVTPASGIAAELDPSTFNHLYRELCRSGVHFERDHVVTAFADGTVGIRHVRTDALTELSADVLVAGLPRVGMGLELADLLQVDVPVCIVGDALLPRDASAAIREGQEATRGLFGPSASEPPVAALDPVDGFPVGQWAR